MHEDIDIAISGKINGNNQNDGKIDNTSVGNATLVQEDGIHAPEKSLDAQAHGTQNTSLSTNNAVSHPHHSVIISRKRKHHHVSNGVAVGTSSKRHKTSISQNDEKKRTLLEEYYDIKSESPSYGQKQQDDVEQQLELERKLLEIVSKKMPLTALSQRREGVLLSGCVGMGWEAPPYINKMPQEVVSTIREENRIDVQGQKVPHPIQDFLSMRLPESILKVLREKNIVLPTAIQMQALPILMSGRDLLGVAYTGSGKTLTFSVPMIMHALLEEHKMPVRGGEGPIGLILCPSRELAKQTGDVVQRICQQFFLDGYPLLRTMFCIGGRSMKEDEELLARGVHMVIATPGRLKHMLNIKKFNLDSCKYFCLDEADRLVDMGFEETIREIFDYLTARDRQTVLFSATMPAKIRLFAESALTDHVIVNVGRAGSANVNIVQEVEYVRTQDKIRHLVESLKKSPPPAIIFAQNKDDVDEIHEYLLLKGIRASSIHGGKTQAEREESIQEFVSGAKSVLVATDIASKGLDFKGIEHVINFDLPQEIEDYVHRIGRTGRGAAKGLATSYINEEAALHLLLDLRGLLMESKQHVPKMLQDLGEQLGVQTEIGGTKGCLYCGGLGHRITQCRKLERDRKEMMNQSKSEDSLR